MKKLKIRGKLIVSYIIIASFAFLTISPFTDIVEAETLQQYKNAVAELEKKKDNTEQESTKCNS